MNINTSNKGHKGPYVNQQITSKNVRVVGPDGEMIGVLDLSEAIQKAEEYGLDLVEVSPNAEPPVCKILDYGKYRYEIQKKAKEAKKKQKVIHIKEIKIRLNTDVHDFDVKKNNARRFIEDGDKVKVSLRFRGREITHKNLGEEKLNQFASDLSDIAKIESATKMEGRQLVLVLSPQ